MANHPNRSRRTKNPAANPTPQEIRAAREKAGMTQTEAARLVYSNLRQWQRWEADPSAETHRRMRPLDWEVFLARTGLGPPITPEN